MRPYTDSTTGLEIDACPECYGLWFDKEELRQFFESPELSGQVLQEEATLALATSASAPVPELPEQRLPCPQCREPMQSSRLGSTQVDYCLRCRGIWLDRWELERMVQAYQSGERGNLLIVNQLVEGLGTPWRPNPKAQGFLQVLESYRRAIEAVRPEQDKGR